MTKAHRKSVNAATPGRTSAGESVFLSTVRQLQWVWNLKFFSARQLVLENSWKNTKQQRFGVCFACCFAYCEGSNGFKNVHAQVKHAATTVDGSPCFYCVLAFWLFTTKPPLHGFCDIHGPHGRLSTGEPIGGGFGQSKAKKFMQQMHSWHRYERSKGSWPYY